MAKERTQILTLPPLAADRQLPAPGGWKFDATAVLVWSALLQHVRESRDLRTMRLKRDLFVCESRIYLLANLLSNALGMAPPYWTSAAEAYAERR